MCCHEKQTLHDTSKRGPRKHVMEMHCSVVVVPHEIMRVKMKLQLSGTVFSCSCITCVLQIILSYARKYIVLKGDILTDCH